MQIQLIAVGDKMPSWINEGYNNYAKRLPQSCSLTLCEIPLGKRHNRSNIKQLQEKESDQILSSIGKNNHVVALEINGGYWSTEQLATELKNWQQLGKNISLLIGGPEGLLSRVSNTAQQKWSLSPLTLPHPVVRLIIAEQIYRAWSILSHHPYHR